MEEIEYERDAEELRIKGLFVALAAHQVQAFRY
jgi:hypothetical protein